MPASTSSNTSVAPPDSLATPISASITRETSPPEAMSRSGPAGTPGLAAIRNSTTSAPVGPGSRSCSATAKLAPSMASDASRSRTDSASAGPAASRAACSSSDTLPSATRASSSAAVASSSASSAPASSARRARQRSACSSTAATLPPCLRARRSTAAKPRLDHVQTLRLGLQPFGVAAQLAGQVVGLQRQRPVALGQRVQRRVDALDGVQLGAAAGQRQARAALAVLGRDRLEGQQRRAAQRLDVAQAVALDEQGPLLGLVGIDLLDLGQLVVEQVDLALASQRPLTQRAQRRLQRAHPTRRARPLARGAPPARRRRSGRARRAAPRTASSRRCSCWP